MQCVGCGFCCMKARCWVSLFLYADKEGICPGLYWNGSMYRCKPIELTDSIAKELFAGEGCCAGLNTWRCNVRERSGIKDNDRIT